MPGIKHAAVVTVADDEVSPVGSDEWNAPHVIEDGTITASMLAEDVLTYIRTKSVVIMAVEPTVDVTVGEGKAYLVVSPLFNGMNLVYANASVITPGVTDATTVDVYNVTKSCDMLATHISIPSGATLGTAGTVNDSYDDVATGDCIRIDVTNASSTKAKGLIVMLEFRLPDGGST